MMTSGGHYDSANVLQAADTHTVAFLVLGGLALISMFICFGEAARLGFSERTFSIPVVGNMYFLAHDWTYVASAHSWWVDIGHWFPVFFWVAICGTAAFEAVFLFQAIAYGRDELLPKVSQKTFAAMMLAAQAGAFVVFWCMKAAMNDDLFLINFGVTITWLMMFSIPMMVRRGSRRGQSVLHLSGALGLATFFWPATMLLDDYFRSPLWIALGAVTVAWAALNLAIFRRFDPQPDTTFGYGSRDVVRIGAPAFQTEAGTS